MIAYLGTAETAIGTLRVAVDESGAVLSVKFADGDYRETLERWLAKRGYEPIEDAAMTAGVSAQLIEYGLGERRTFDLPLAQHGTPWQLTVWRALTEIPFGETRTYGELAVATRGHARYSRAVGSANGSNPIPIIVPCHRVVGANGALTGFAGGIELKSRLLEHEGIPTATCGDQYQLALDGLSDAASQSGG